MLSCCFPKGVRQGSKHILPSRSCQFTLPFPIDEATGHRHSESCQQRWQWKSSRGSLPFPTQQSRESVSPTEPAHLVLTQTPAWLLQAWLPTAQRGPFVIYLDAYWPYFLGTVMWEYVLLEDLGGGGAQHCLALSFPLNSPVQSSWPPHPSPSERCRLRWRQYFPAFDLYQNFQTFHLQNGIRECHLSPCRH